MNSSNLINKIAVKHINVQLNKFIHEISAELGIKPGRTQLLYPVSYPVVPQPNIQFTVHISWPKI